MSDRHFRLTAVTLVMCDLGKTETSSQIRILKLVSVMSFDNIRVNSRYTTIQ